MLAAKYDTFEDEKEINAMIAFLQSRTKEYMSRPDAWDVPVFDIKEERS